MKRFLIKVFYFILPISLVLFPAFLILWGSGENFREINSILNSDKKFLIGYAYNGDNYKYMKWVEMKDSPSSEVVALGSSRVLQFRNKMFESSFYNSGYAIEGISDFHPFLNAVPKEKLPKYLIISLDQWMFNKNWDDLSITPDISYWQNSFDKKASFRTFLTVYEDLFKGKYGFSILNQESAYEKIGLNAHVNNLGFRNDGSMYYGNQIQMLIKGDPKADDYLYHDTFNRIKEGKLRFEYGERANLEAVKELEVFLNFCQENNIYVIAFLPPFADKVYSKMQSSGKYKYLDELPIILSPLLLKYGFEFYDYSTVASCGSSDSETIDGFHGGESTYIKMLVGILNKGSKLNSVTNKNKLLQDLENRKNRYIVYDY